MQLHGDRDFETATEIVRLVRSFRAVLAGHALKYRTVDGLGAVAAFIGEVERDLARYKNKFLGITLPPGAEQLAVIDDLTDQIESNSRTAMDRQTANNRVGPRAKK